MIKSQVYWSTHSQARHKKENGLFLQCIICITECGKGDDDGKWSTVSHGFFQGDYGEYIHRINFRQVSEHTEPKVKQSYYQKKLFG